MGNFPPLHAKSGLRKPDFESLLTLTSTCLLSFSFDFSDDVSRFFSEQAFSIFFLCICFELLTVFVFLEGSLGVLLISSELFGVAVEVGFSFFDLLVELLGEKFSFSLLLFMLM